VIETLVERVAAVRLCLRSWYGHPEEQRMGKLYQLARQQDRHGAEDMFESGLRCWDLFADDGTKLGRVYEPTPITPRWVWCDGPGNEEIDPLLTIEELTVLVVEYRLKGGLIE
jgi:hypothetical protein